MIERRRLSISDLMLGVCLMGAVFGIVQEPKLHASPSSILNVIQYELWTRDTTYWLCPFAVWTCVLTLLVASVFALFARGGARSFLAGLAVGGWLLFGLVFGTGVHNSSWLAANFFPLTWLHGLAEPMAELTNGIPYSQGDIQRGCDWVLTLRRAGPVIDSTACIVFGAACGGLALMLLRLNVARLQSVGLFRRAYTSAWGPLILILSAGTLGCEAWEGRLLIVAPLVTSFLVLLACSWMLALAGPLADRVSNRAFAIVATAYLTLAFSPFFAGWGERLPSSMAGRPIVRAFFATESTGSKGLRTYYATFAFTQLCHVATAWLLGCAAWYLVGRRPRNTIDTTGDTAAHSFDSPSLSMCGQPELLGLKLFVGRMKREGFDG